MDSTKSYKIYPYNDYNSEFLIIILKIDQNRAITLLTLIIPLIF